MKPIRDPFIMQKLFQTQSAPMPSNRRQISALIATLGTASLTTIATLFWLYIVQPDLASSNSRVHPTSIPWLQNQEDCEKTARTWQNGTCLDSEHSPDF
jgi:hypothetical protein